VSCENCEKLKAALEQALYTNDMERRRLGMDLHDDICQRLSGISMYCMSLVNIDNPGAFLPEISQLIDETITRLKKYTDSVFILSEENQSLKKTLEILCRRASEHSMKIISFIWNADIDWPREPRIKLNLYRIIQEALHNALKHSAAKEIEVNANCENGVFTIFINDNGIGGVKLADENSGGFGLNSIRFRAKQLGGTVSIKSDNPGGTRITVSIPEIMVK
jgi:signal transduction histidine kinase